MCKVYSSYVYNELKKNHILARLINTSDLGFDYEHQFILVPINKLTKDYYLIDLTYSQFIKNIEDEKVFTELLNKGYQKINNELWIQYLKNPSAFHPLYYKLFYKKNLQIGRASCRERV